MSKNQIGNGVGIGREVFEKLKAAFDRGEVKSFVCVTTYSDSYAKELQKENHLDGVPRHNLSCCATKFQAVELALDVIEAVAEDDRKTLALVLAQCTERLLRLEEKCGKPKA